MGARRSAPPGTAALVLPYDAQPMDCSLHPSEPLVAAALIDGRLIATRFDAGAGTHESSINLKAHSKAARAVTFAPDGRLLLTASTDCSILAVDAASGKPVARLGDAHEGGIDRLTFVSDAVLASGDEDGGIRLWDTRARNSCGAFSAHTDYITDLTPHPPQHGLLATSGDGTLSLNDLRTFKVAARSEEDAEEELCCCALVRGGRKVVCGASEGAGSRGAALNIFSTGYWNGPSDRLPGHPASVEAMVAVDDSTIATGCNDGCVRLLQIQPHRMLETLGMHGQAGGRRRHGAPVEALAHCAALQVLASAGHDDTVRIWALNGDAESDEWRGREVSEDGPAVATASDGKLQDAVKAVASTVAPVLHSDSDSDAPQKKRKKAQKGAHRIQRRGEIAASKAAFFSDLL